MKTAEDAEGRGAVLSFTFAGRPKAALSACAYTSRLDSQLFLFFGAVAVEEVFGAGALFPFELKLE